MRRHIFTQLQEGNLGLFQALRLETNLFNGVTDAKAIYVYKPGDLPAKVYRLDLSTGHKTLWKELMPSDSAGVSRIGPILLTHGRQVMPIWLSPYSVRPLSRGRIEVRELFS